MPSLESTASVNRPSKWVVEWESLDERLVGPEKGVEESVLMAVLLAGLRNLDGWLVGREMRVV